MCGSNCKLANELALGPTVALAERVDGVDFTKVESCSLCKHCSDKSLQQTLATQLTECILQRGGDMQRWTEHGIAL